MGRLQSEFVGHERGAMLCRPILCNAYSLLLQATSYRQVEAYANNLHTPAVSPLSMSNCKWSYFNESFPAAAQFCPNPSVFGRLVVELPVSNTTQRGSAKTRFRDENCGGMLDAKLDYPSLPVVHLYQNMLSYFGDPREDLARNRESNQLCLMFFPLCTYQVRNNFEGHLL